MSENQFDEGWRPCSDDINAGLLQHRYYTSQKIFRLELEKLFSRTWIYVGHECQIKNPGDYILSHIGLVSVILIRGKDGSVNVLENRCPHRGSPVCLEPAGKRKVLTCPYHGWSFHPNGDLRSIPMIEEYAKDFSKESHGMQRVPRVSTYRGFVFASLAETGPDLETFLGEAKIALDDFMDRAPEGELEPADQTPLRHRYRGNWKIQFENLGDVIHPAFAHASAMGSVQATNFEKEGAGDRNLSLLSGFGELLKKIREQPLVISEYGHSYIPGMQKLSGVNASVDAELENVLAASRGDEEAKRIMETDVWLVMIYPSLIIKPGTQNLRIIRPLAHDETEITMQIFKMPGAPESVLTEAFEYQRNLGSPAAPVLSDDLAIYEAVQADYERNYAISAERGGAFKSISMTDGPATPGTSEEYIRQQYSVWQRYLFGDLS